MYEVADLILRAKSYSSLKIIRKRIKYSEKWEEVKEEILKEICLLKMRSISEVRKKLFESSDMDIVFCSPFERYLGVGVSRSVAELISPEEYRGRNVLGQIWNDIKQNYTEEIGTHDVLAKRCISCLRRRSDINSQILCTSCLNYWW